MWKKVRTLIFDVAVGVAVCVLLGHLPTYLPAGHDPSAGRIPRAEARLAFVERPAASASYTPSDEAAYEELGGDSTPPRAVERAGRTALLIGIDNASGGIPLEGAVTDAVNTYAALLRYGFEAKDVTMLTDREATRGRILDELGSLAERTAPDGVAVFLFAGHSSVSESASFRTAEGARVKAAELASALGAVRARMWIALPTCGAGGYALPGVVGPNRVTTFASSAGERSYELGASGSYMIKYMVEQGMLEGRAAASVEDAFRYAKDTIEQAYPNRVPLMSDGTPEDQLSLSSVPGA